MGDGERQGRIEDPHSRRRHSRIVGDPQFQKRPPKEKQAHLNREHQIQREPRAVNHKRPHGVKVAASLRCADCGSERRCRGSQDCLGQVHDFVGDGEVSDRREIEKSADNKSIGLKGEPPCQHRDEGISAVAAHGADRFAIDLPRDESQMRQTPVNEPRQDQRFHQISHGNDEHHVQQPRFGAKYEQ